MEESKKDEKRLTIIETVNLLVKEISDLKVSIMEKMAAIEEKMNAPTPLQNPTVQTTSQFNSDTQTSPVLFPIPLAWRDIVNTVLNKSFGIEVDYMTDTPNFKFTIIVPEKYSNMTPSQKQMYGNIDRRLIVLENAVGENGVREWAEKVFSNLGTEIQALIVNDRVTSM